MNILFFAPPAFTLQTENKGSGNWVSSLINALKTYAKKSIQITVAVFDPSTQRLDHVEIQGVTYARIPVEKPDNTFAKFRKSWFGHHQQEEKKAQYLSVIENVKPDLIQLFGIEHDYISILGETRIPIVIHLQGMRGPYWLKDMSSRRFNKTFSLREMVSGQSDAALEKKIRRRLEREESLYKHIQYFFGRTDWDRYFARAVAPDAVYMYCQEIMRESFYNTCWEMPSQNQVFQIYSTLSASPRKNVDIIYRADQLLRKHHPRLNVVWKIGGLNSSSAIYQKIRKSGLDSERVKLLGKLDAKEIISHMKSSHLYVFPSSIDNSPNSLQEAMLAGMPVVATHAGGVSSLVEHNQTGILIPEGEPYALAGAVSELSVHRTKMIQLGKNAREVAVKRNSPKYVVESLLKGYTRILNASTPK